MFILTFQNNRQQNANSAMTLNIDNHFQKSRKVGVRRQCMLFIANLILALDFFLVKRPCLSS